MIKPVLASFFIVLMILSIFPVFAYNSGPIVPPPTNAYSKIQTSNSTVYARSYDQLLKLSGVGVLITGSNGSKTIIFTVTGSGGGTNASSITCSVGQFIYMFDNSTALFTCRTAITTINGDTTTNQTIASGQGITVTNSGSTHTIATNFKVNSLTCSSGFFSAFSNSTGNFTCTSGSGSGETLDTMQNIGGGQVSIYAGNNTNTNFQFKTASAGTGISITNGTSLINIATNFKVASKACGGTDKLNSFDNVTGIFTCSVDQIGVTTGSNVGTSGYGFFRDVTGSTMNFRNLTTSRSDLFTLTQSTNNVNLGSSFKADSKTCTNQFFASFDNVTGIFACASIVAIQSSQNIGKAGQGVLASPSADHINGKNITSTKNINVYGNDTTIDIRANNTAYSQNILSNNGISGGSGIGFYKNNTNSTLQNFKSLVSINTFTKIEGNTSSVIINSTVPTNNVVDIYDSTSSDYTTPSNAVGSSNGNPVVSLSNLFTYDTLNETSGNVIDQCNNVGGGKCATDTGTQTVTGASQGVAGKIGNAINFTAATNRIATGSSSEAFMHNQTAQFTLSYWFKKEQTPAGASGLACGVGLGGVVAATINNDAGQGFQICNKYALNKIQFLVARTSSGNPVINATYSHTFDTNWHFIVLSYKYTNATNNACLSIDGGAYTCITKTANAAVNTAQSSNLQIGNRPNNDQSCGCALDEFAIFKNQDLTISQAISLYGSGSGRSLQSSLYTIDGVLTTEWKSNSQTNPLIYFDMGSMSITSANAIYPDTSSTTCTQILYQTSTDASSWTTKRTINTSLLTNAAWNFARWDLDSNSDRYVRVYCNDGVSRILAIYEDAVLEPSSTTLLLRHGHEFIDSTNATVPLNR